MKAPETINSLIVWLKVCVDVKSKCKRKKKKKEKPICMHSNKIIPMAIIVFLHNSISHAIQKFIIPNDQKSFAL